MSFGKIRKLLLGFDPDEIKEIKDNITEIKCKLEEAFTTIQSLKEEIDKLKGTKVDIKYIQSIEEHLSSLDNLINSLCKITNVKRQKKKKLANLSTSDKHQLVMELIRKGINTSSELRKHVPFSVRELYEVLNDLEKMSKVGQIKEGRKKRYYIIEAKNGFVQPDDYI